MSIESITSIFESDLFKLLMTFIAIWGFIELTRVLIKLFIEAAKEWALK
ncbi:MAG: hypothetical protein NDF54_08155 [archaeon GB-1867-035]|nr:hypothetical protein [Candidatus Culexmicrobium profundum]